MDQAGDTEEANGGGIEEAEDETSIVHADDVRESFKLGFEAVKHLTTLSASSFVVIATFLKDIFPKPNKLVTEDKVLIALAFLCFAISLVISVYSLWRLATMVRSRRPYERKKPKIRSYIAAPSLLYVFGLSFFGTAVLANVFFGAATEPAPPPGPQGGGRGDLERSLQWVPLGAFLIMVTLVFFGRYIISSLRDTNTQYTIVYPAAEECKELQGPRKPRSTAPSYVIRLGGWAAMAAGVVWVVSGILAVGGSLHSPPNSFAFYSVIGIFYAALVLTVVGMVGLRALQREEQRRHDTLMAQPLALRPPEARNDRLIGRARVGFYTVAAVLLGQVLGAVVLWAKVRLPVAEALGLYGANVLLGLLLLGLGYLQFLQGRALDMNNRRSRAARI
jgi:hypothetical protein